MFRRIAASVTVKFSLATLLLAFSVVASAGTMRCLLGVPMEAEPQVTVQAPIETEPGCCKPAAPEPEPEKKAAKCCCIDALKKNVVDFGSTHILDFRIDFPILTPPAFRIEFSEEPVVVKQVAWPEAHGPPGTEQRTPSSPRAPPAA